MIREGNGRVEKEATTLAQRFHHRFFLLLRGWLCAACVYNSISRHIGENGDMEKDTRQHVHARDVLINTVVVCVFVRASVFVPCRLCSHSFSISSLYVKGNIGDV